MGKPKEKRKPWEGYSVESLHRAIRSCEVNIVTFQDAIEKERQTMASYRWMIEKIEEKKEKAIEAKVMGDAVAADIKRQNDEFEAEAKSAGRKVVYVKTGKEKDNGNPN